MAKKKPQIVDVLTVVETRLTQERQEAQACLQMIQTLPMSSPEDRDRAGRLINSAKDKIKALEADRREVVDPINADVRRINGWYKPVVEFYEACQRSLKDRLAARLKELQAEQDAALATVQAQAGHASAEVFAIAHATPSAPEAVQQREVWKFEVVDFSKLPDEYKMADEAKIRKVVQALKADCDIPGIRLIPEIQIVAGRT